MQKPFKKDDSGPSRTGDFCCNSALWLNVDQHCEKIANVVDKVPFVTPVAALLFEVLKTCKEIKDMGENRNTLKTQLGKITKDLDETKSRLEAVQITERESLRWEPGHLRGFDPFTTPSRRGSKYSILDGKMACWTQKNGRTECFRCQARATGSILLIKRLQRNTSTPESRTGENRHWY
ncbi:hypothetical protein C8R44DRAFT_741731 [Mycena epipterygia]|nr:hypothetical protein C8R44DRAFT_741731 [Mycena epipterygia]